MNIDAAIAELFRLHIKMLETRGVVAENQVETNSLSLPHALWMCETALKGHLKEGWSIDKVSRWQGYVQAVLVVHKVSSVEDERDVTRKLMA